MRGGRLFFCRNLQLAHVKISYACMFDAALYDHRPINCNRRLMMYPLPRFFMHFFRDLLTQPKITIKPGCNVACLHTVGPGQL